jgi:hypothetical protein
VSYVELEDGTRVYDHGLQYKPLAPEERKYKVRKPDDPRAVRFKGDWLLPLPLLPDENRVWPETVADDETLRHKAWCRCYVCNRPIASEVWKRNARHQRKHLR